MVRQSERPPCGHENEKQESVAPFQTAQLREAGTMTTGETPIEHPPAVTDISLFREAILRHAGAEAALDELGRHGVDPDQFLALLEFTVSVLHRPKHTRRQQDWEIPGMPPRRLLKLAERLEELARELQTIDSHPFSSHTWSMISDEEKEEFNGVPDLLRRRGFALSVQVSVSKVLHPFILRMMERQGRLNLVDFVRQSTKKHCPKYKEVALLLTAALYEVGRDEIVTPESLRTLWHDDQIRTKLLENPT
jgi:hypothetical protein